MTRNHQQEALTRVYIQAVAARCGMSVSYRDYDYGIDVTLHDIQHQGGEYTETGWKLDIQAKSIVNPRMTRNAVHYDLRVETYEALRRETIGMPRILVLFILPQDEKAWLDLTEEALLIRKAAYWLSLEGMNPTPNKSMVRIEIPRRNLFSPTGLRGIMERIQKGEPL
jgi:hypothetical protein